MYFHEEIKNIILPPPKKIPGALQLTNKGKHASMLYRNRKKKSKLTFSIPSDFTRPTTEYNHASKNKIYCVTAKSLQCQMQTLACSEFQCQRK